MIKLTDILNEDCWKGYKQVGGKMKNGKMVPNCVPESVVSEDSPESAHPQGSDKLTNRTVVMDMLDVISHMKFGPDYHKLSTSQKKEVHKEAIKGHIIKNKPFKESVVKEELSSQDRTLIYKLTTMALKAMPKSQKQKEIIKKLNFVRTKNGMKALSEDSTITEIGIFPIKNYLKGMIPSKMWNTTTPQNKEKLKSTINDLIRTLNQFWKQHNIPFRVREGVTQNEDLRKWFGKGKTGSTKGGGWDRYSSTGKKLGKCGDGEKGDAYAACLSKEKANKLGPKGRASFVNRKRADQKKAGDSKKGGNRTKGKTPTFSKTGA